LINDRNVRRLALVSILTSIDLFSAIEVAFFLQKDLTASQIYMIYSIFSILIFLLEVPTGYISDKIGYKKSIILGLICGMLGFMGFIFGKGFRVISIAYFFMALMNTLISGSDDALLYDTLKESGVEDKFEVTYSKIASYGYFASIIGSILGGIIAGVSMNINVVVQTIFVIVGLCILTLVKSPKQFDYGKENIEENIQYKRKEIKAVATVLILAGFFMASTLIGTKFSQQIMLSANLPVSFFGFFAALLTVMASIFSYIAPKCKKVPFSIIMLMPALILIAIGISQNGFFVFLLLITSASRALGNVKITTLINNKISSKYRATINSVKSLLFRLFYSIIILVCGKVADYDIFLAVMLSGIILFIMVSIFLIVRCVVEKHELST